MFQDSRALFWPLKIEVHFGFVVAGCFDGVVFGVGLSGGEEEVEGGELGHIRFEALGSEEGADFFPFLLGLPGFLAQVVKAAFEAVLLAVHFLDIWPGQLGDLLFEGGDGSFGGVAVFELGGKGEFLVLVVAGVEGATVGGGDDLHSWFSFQV